MSATLKQPRVAETVRIIWDLAGERRHELRRALVLRCVNAALMAVPVGVVAVLITDLRDGQVSAGRAWTMSLSLVGGLLLQLVVARRANVLLLASTYLAGRDLRARLLDQVRRLPVGFHSRRRAGDTLTALTQDTRSLENFFAWSLPALAADIVLPLMVVVILAVIDVPMALAVIVSVVVSLPVLRWTYRRYARFAAARQELQAQAVSRIVEHIQGIATVRAFNQAGTRQDKLRETLDEFRDMDRTILKAVAPASYGHATVVGLGLPVILLIGSYWLFGGRIDEGTLIVFLVLSLRVYQPLLDIAAYVEGLPLIAASLGRVVDLLESPPLAEPASGRGPERFDVAFEAVDFSYRTGAQTLSEVSFVVPQRSMTAVIGPSGAGKTTILSLVARFWDPDAGAVRIGGVDLREMGAHELYEAISVVFQEPYLFQGSIFDNIAAGRPDAERSAVRAAGASAGCDEFAPTLPAGYETLVGEGGRSLSTGERQRVALARAILKDAPIVLLDEATAALDPSNEKLVQQALANLIADKTLIVVAHRLSTVRGADQIIVVNDGRIVQRGTHDELLQREGIYARFWDERRQAAHWKLTGANGRDARARG